MKHFNTVKQFLFLALFVSAVIIGVNLVKTSQEIRERALTTPSLYVRTDKSYIPLGDSYKLIVFSDYKNLTEYSGNLEVGSNCDSQGINCASINPWKNFDGSLVYVNNGTVTINVPLNINPFTVTNIRIRPYPNTLGFNWSNNLTIGNGTASGLIDTTLYYLMPTTPIEFTGENRSFDNTIPFTTVIGFNSTANLCSNTGQEMYFMKDKPEGYWNPRTPWHDDKHGGDTTYSKLNLIWPLAHWQQKSGWYDNFLTAIGDRRYFYNPDSLSKSDNFMNLLNGYKYGSDNPALPGYFLTAKYVANGWGLANSQATGGYFDGSSAFCSVQPSASRNPLWTVHADKKSLTGYSDVLRLRYYEGENGFITDRTKYGLREDWYFARNVGLVKIDVKAFCPTTWKTYEKCKPCFDDVDCLSEKIGSPQITLSRKGPYLTPTNTPTPRPTNTPTPRPTNTPTPRPTNTPTPTVRPTNTPTPRPTNTPTPRPTNTPTPRPTNTPTPRPTNTPTRAPTNTSTPGVKIGDADGDGIVGIGDYAIWVSQYLKSIQSGKDADFDNDADIDGVDFVFWVNNYGK